MISVSAAPATASSTQVQSSVTSWRPTGTYETLSRIGRWTENMGVLSTGRLSVFGGLVIPAGKTVSAITFYSGAQAAVTPTNQWFCLVDQSLNVLGKTVDDTTTAWGALAKKSLAMAANYTATSDIAVYLGIMVAAGTVPNLTGQQNIALILGETPMIAASSTTGLTTPASLGGTAGALTALTGVVYATATVA